MVLLNFSNVKKNFGAETLFENVSFNIKDTDKIGLTGVNGAGKTTLFRIITDNNEKTMGEILYSKSCKIGYMEQHISASSENTLYDEIMTVFSDLEDMENRLSEIALKIHENSGTDDSLIAEQFDLSQEFERKGGFTYKSRAKACLMGLGFNENEFSQPFNSLSGGQKTRAVLCKILLGNSNLLLLDEPTNHLDIKSVEWLENFLKDYNGAFIVISHDRYFLDKVTNRTFELENGRLTVYESNYSGYAEQKRIKELTLERNYEKTTREIARLERIVKQQRQWNREKNIRTAESKLKVIERLKQTLVKPDGEQQSIHFKFKVNKSCGNEVLKCENISMAFGNKVLFNNLDLFIKKGERVFLLGPNGCGKTTLFKIILNQIKALSGEVKLGANVEMGYYAQTQDDLNENTDVFNEIYDTYPSMSGTEIRNALSAFLFRGDDVFKSISLLSGGERARVSIAKIMLGGFNFLLMDEPTNHLDIKSRVALEDALSEYDGTLFIVSHDRYFINSIADRICYMDENGLMVYNGDYDFFAEKFRERQRTVNVKNISDSKLDYKEQKAAAAAKKKAERLLSDTEEKISEVESKLDEYKNLLLTDEYATDYIKATETTQKIEELENELEALYEKWEELSYEKNGN